MSRKLAAVLILFVAAVTFLALAWASLRDLAWLARSASGDGTALEAIRVLLAINGLPIAMLGGLMLVLFAIYWRLFVRRDEDAES